MYDLAVVTTVPTIQYGHLNADFPLHSHRCWEIHLVSAGRGTLEQAGRSLPLEPGLLTLSDPGRDHRLTVSAPLSFFYLQFDADPETASVLKRLWNLQESGRTLEASPSALDEASRLKDRLDSPVADRVASGVHGFRAWLYDLAAGGDQKAPDGIDEALGWLGRHLDRRLSLDDLAAVAGLDRFAFAKRFRARTGLPPLAYVHRSKVEAAAFLLQGTDLPLADVAARLGFCDEFHFGKVFKKWRGTSPGRWRETHLVP